MAGDILRKTGVVIFTILKGILQIVLILFKFVLTMLKLFLVLFSFVLRIFLAVMGVPVRD